MTQEVPGLLSFPYSVRQFLLLALDFNCVIKVPNCAPQKSYLKCMLNFCLSQLNFVSLSCIFPQLFHTQGMEREMKISIISYFLVAIANYKQNQKPTTQ